jgi:multiple sugar transport system ATP-binding protein
LSRITLSNLCKSYGAVDVLRDINLDIVDGELMVFVGPSGCGKSTLLRQIAGLDKPSSGEIRIDGKLVNDVPAADRGLAMVFQSYALYPHMSVRQNLAFGLENARLPRAEIEARISEAARMLEIGGLLERRPGQLSGGQRQRVAIGRAIVRNPTAFLLDEPLSNLDAELRISTRAELAALHQRLKATMIYVTHDQVEAMTLADRIVVLRSGRIEQVGTPLDLYNRPANRFVAGFIGAPRMNFLSAVVTANSGGALSLPVAAGRAISFEPGDVAARPGDEVTVGIRPQHIKLMPSTAGGLPASVRLVEALGSETIVHTDTDDGRRLLVVLEGQHRIAAGEKIGLRIEKAHVHLFDAEGNRLEVASSARVAEAV